MQHLGQVQVDGQMMNLWSVQDLFNTFNTAVDVSKQALDTAKQLAPAVDNLWQQVDPNSYNQAGGLGGVVGVADDTLNTLDGWGDWAQSSFGQQQLQDLWGVNMNVPGMGSAGFGKNGFGVNTQFGGIGANWNQQQLQQLGFWGDLKKFGRNVQQALPQAQQIVNTGVGVGTDLWRQFSPDTYNQYGDAVSQGVNMGNQWIDTAAGIKFNQQQLQDLWGVNLNVPGMGSAGFGKNGFGVNTQFGGIGANWNQQQLQQLGFWGDLKKFGRNVQQALPQAQQIVNTGVGVGTDLWRQFSPDTYSQYGDAVSQGVNMGNNIIDTAAGIRFNQQQLLI